MFRTFIVKGWTGNTVEVKVLSLHSLRSSHLVCQPFFVSGGNIFTRLPDLLPVNKTKKKHTNRNSTITCFLSVHFIETLLD